MPYRVIEPVRISPSYGSIEELEEYRDLLLLAVQETKPFMGLGFRLKLPDGKHPRFTSQGKMVAGPLVHNLWNGDAWEIHFTGFVTTVRPSYLEAIVKVNDPAAGEQAWIAPNGATLPKPTTTKVTLPLDFSTPRNAAKDLNDFVTLVMDHLVECGLAIKE